MDGLSKSTAALCIELAYRKLQCPAHALHEALVIVCVQASRQRVALSKMQKNVKDPYIQTLSINAEKNGGGKRVMNVRISSG
jgi:hypothetical protein